jgi:hypothetical protein
MKRTRVAVGATIIFSFACAIVTACSSKSSTTGGTGTPRPDAGTCTTECCELPMPGTSCYGTDGGVTCTYAVTCQEGLVLSRSTMCEDGYWKPVNDCPVTGGVDERGCPSAQPADKSPCTVPPNQGSPSCGYSKTCEAKVCDASDCVQVHESATATCVNGMWQSTPLGPC